MNIVRIERNGVEFFTVEATGESGMSVSGLARLCGVAQPRISEILHKSAIGLEGFESLKPLLGKNCELSVGSSYKNVTVIADWACACIIEYYALDARKTTPEAKYALRQFNKMGVRSWIQSITGWQQPQTTKLSPYWCDRLIVYYQRNQIPPGWWSIFEETIKIVAELERCGYVMPEDQIVDISVGLCWANYLRSKGYIVKGITQTYPHWYPGWKYPVDAYLYPDSLRADFQLWLKAEYIPHKLPAYFRTKDSSALPAIARMLGLPQSK
jgi:hypothetical protein